MTDPALAAHALPPAAMHSAGVPRARLVAARVGQPLVVAEMVAGFLLGPSFFGWIADPALQVRLFPADYAAGRSRSEPGRSGALHVLRRPRVPHRLWCARQARIGVRSPGSSDRLCLRRPARLLLRTRPGSSPIRSGHVQAAIFLGTALSITAFPVLARIISERGISGTTVGLARARRRRDGRRGRVDHAGGRARQPHRRRDAGGPPPAAVSLYVVACCSACRGSNRLASRQRR